MKLPLWRRKQKDELDEELRAHHDAAVQERIERGEPRAQAESAARREMGNTGLIAEITREMWGWASLDRLLQDVRYGLRQLRRNPGFTLTAVLTLALGIGANTAIFSAVNSVLLRPLPYRDSDRLVAVFNHEKRMGEPRNPTSPFDFHQWQQNRVFEAMAAATPWEPVLTGYDRPDRLDGLRASATLFQLLGAEAALGRTFREPDGEIGSHRVVVLGHNIWQRRFGSDRALVGRTLLLDSEPYTVIGVMPPGFRFPPFWAVDAEFWAPLTFTPDERNRRARFLRAFARLKPGVTLAQARSEMDGIARRLEQEAPQSNKSVGVTVEPLQEPVVHGIRPVLVALLGAAGFVLLIGCANIANLLLARASVRSREFAVRMALGASRARLVPQLLTESLLLALLSGAAGLLLGVWLLGALRGMMAESLPRIVEVQLDWRVLAFAFAVSLLTAIATGLAPALQAGRGGLVDALKSGTRQTSGGSSRLRGGLVVSEVALAVVLLAGAGLMLQSVWRLANLDPGFRREQVLTAEISFAGERYETVEQQFHLVNNVQQRISALPGVEAAALTNHLPIGGDVWRFQFVVDGQPLPPSDQMPLAVYRAATPGLFRALGIRLVRGRDFSATDTPGSEPVILVNETAARRYFGGEDPVGKRIRLGGLDSKLPWLTVVGVTSDVRQGALAEDVPPEMYLPYAQQLTEFYRNTTLVVHTRGETAPLEKAIQQVTWDLDANLPVTRIRTIEQILEGEVRLPRRQGLLIAAFAGVALLLAGIGLYGVVSYMVARRTQEIGVRMALGAQRGDILRLVVGQGMGLVTLGLSIGLAGAWMLTRWVEGLLFQVSPTDPATFAAVSVLLGLVALLACCMPARRAVRVDPMTALRQE